MSNSLILKVALPVLAVFMTAGQAFAAVDCDNQPTCEQMGYAKGEPSNCDQVISCPYDVTYKKCVEKHKSCTDLGFTKEDKSGWCKDVVKCPEDASYTLCKEGVERFLPEKDDFATLANAAIGNCKIGDATSKISKKECADKGGTFSYI